MDYTKKYIKYKKKYLDLKQELEGGGDKNKALAAVKQDGKALAGLSKELRGDKEVALAAVKQDGYALEHASEKLRGDREIVLAAVQEDGNALEFASEKLRGDREVVLAAVQQKGYALQYASEELREDRLFLIKCYKLNKNINKYNNFIKEFDNLENGIFNDSFIIENKDIINLIENKKKLYEYLIIKEKFRDIIWEINKDKDWIHFIVNLALRRQEENKSLHTP
jgi:hypothetical protein